jgi:Xaa-Pro aminopeptidase
MLTAEGCAARRSRLFSALPSECEWVLLADPRHVNYLSAFLVSPISFSTLERGFLLVERSGKATLIADNFSKRSAAAPFVDDEIIAGWYDHKHSVENRDHALFSLLDPVLDIVEGRPGLVEAEWLPAMAAAELGADTSFQEIEVGSVLRELRRQKEPDEIALLDACMRACEAGHARALEVVRPGISELDLYREVQSAAVAAAGRPAVVYGDFRTTNAVTPKRGGLPTTEPLNEGDLLILDYSVVLDGYRSDFTNTIAVGEPTPQQEQIFSTVKTALETAEQSLRSGVAARDVYRAASQVLEGAGHSPLVHHAGHGLGLGHPEAPILVPESDDTLLAGDVVTLEPGLYVEGVGGVRLEHNYLITDDGCRRLSHHRLTLKP